MIYPPRTMPTRNRRFLPRLAGVVAAVSSSILAVVAGVIPGCGVETYREALPDPSLSVRFVADGAASDAELLERWDAGDALLVERSVVVGPEHVDHVQLLESGDGARIIVLDLSDVGRERLREATTARVGARLAIVAGGRVVAAPTIREPLTEGEAYVTVDVAHVERAFDALTE